MPNSITQIAVTQHMLANPIVILDGDRASAFSSYHAYHSMPGGRPRVPPFGIQPRDTDVIIAGRYKDNLVRTAKGWVITERFSTIDWQRWVAAAPQAE